MPAGFRRPKQSVTCSSAFSTEDGLFKVTKQESVHTHESAFERNSEPDVPDGWYGFLLIELFEATVEERLVRPTFITDYPVAVSPFAKTCPDPRFVERFEWT